MKKRLKKIWQNCPYLLALLFTWLFMTIGGIALLIYRDYGKLEWSSFWSNPFFAMIMEEEFHHGIGSSLETEPVMVKAAERKSQKKENLLMQDTRERESEWETAVKATLVAGPAEEINQILGSMKENHIEEEQQEIAGRTVFITYTPVETDSIYYSDAGKVALTTEYPYTQVGEDYFDDAAFFGDSRTLGISDYAGLNADFYCENGMTIYKLLGEKGVVYQKSGERVHLQEVLQQKQYGKIYIMLGMNELGYRDTEYFLEQYRTVLEQMMQWQPDAIFYILANLHISQEKNNLDTEFNNININAKNAAAASLADGVRIFYLDVNPLFTDNGGCLKSDLTFDGVHLYAGSYTQWKEFLMEHGVDKKE